MGVISAQEFKNKATKVIEISGFDEDEKFEIRIKPASLLSMMSKGVIPNELMVSAMALFTGPNGEVKGEKDFNVDTESLSLMTSLLDSVCKECLIEPRFDEIGDYLTDTQKNEIFEATQGPLKKVTPFVPNVGNTGYNLHKSSL